MILLVLNTSPLEGILQLIKLLFIVVLVLAITYFVTRWIAKGQKRVSGSSGIEVIDTGRLTNDKYIQIVKVADRYLVLGLSKENITMLTELSEEEVDSLCLEEKKELPGFSDILKNMKSRVEKKDKGGLDNQ
jgi:flagellar protein FliO/FliZ